MAVAATLRSLKILYLHNRLTDFDEIWHPHNLDSLDPVSQ